MLWPGVLTAVAYISFRRTCLEESGQADRQTAKGWKSSTLQGVRRRSSAPPPASPPPEAVATREGKEIEMQTPAQNGIWREGPRYVYVCRAAYTVAFLWSPSSAFQPCPTIMVGLLGLPHLLLPNMPKTKGKGRKRKTSISGHGRMQPGCIYVFRVPVCSWAVIRLALCCQTLQASKARMV